MKLWDYESHKTSNLPENFNLVLSFGTNQVLRKVRFFYQQCRRHNIKTELFFSFIFELYPKWFSVSFTCEEETFLSDSPDNYCLFYSPLSKKSGSSYVQLLQSMFISVYNLPSTFTFLHTYFSYIRCTLCKYCTIFPKCHRKR